MSDIEDRPLWLIGPNYYPSWKSLTRKLLTFVPAIAAVIVALVHLIGGDDSLTIFTRALGAAITAAVNVVFWTTLGFAIAERSDSQESELPTDRTPGQLRAVPDRSIPYGETIGSLVVIGLAVIGIFAQRGLNPEPLFNPNSWNLAIPVILALFGLSAVIEVVKLSVGKWSMTLATINAVVNVTFAGWWVWALVADGLLNEALFANWGMSGSLTTSIFVAVVVLVCVIDTVEGFVGVRKQTSR